MKHFPISFSGKRSGVLFFFLLQAFAASSQIFEVVKADITVNGIAREKAWSMTTHTADGSTDLVFRDGKPVGVKSLRFSLNVADLKSKNIKMDQRAYKALKKYPYNRIQFVGKVMKLTAVGPNNYILLTEGNLNIGGITQIASLLVNVIINSDGTIVCTATKEVKRSDFKIILQPAEERIMKINDTVQIDFKLTLTQIAQSR